MLLCTWTWLFVYLYTRRIWSWVTLTFIAIAGMVFTSDDSTQEIIFSPHSNGRSLTFQLQSSIEPCFKSQNNKIKGHLIIFQMANDGGHLFDLFWFKMWLQQFRFWKEIKIHRFWNRWAKYLYESQFENWFDTKINEFILKKTSFTLYFTR